jgi:DNA-directed RNA polymerase subunit RPC12/RpoP
MALGSKVANPDYRAIARKALARAKTELAKNDPARASYAALEIRRAIEAITYERALLYKDEVPPTVYETWEPSKVVALFAELDPTGDIVPSTRGKGELTQSPGNEIVLKQANLRAQYDELGCYLHLPTVEQLSTGTRQNDKLWSFCETCITILGKVLSSDFQSLGLGIFASHDCARCGKLVMKRLPRDSTGPMEAKCVECGASHKVILDKDGITWRPDGELFPCGNCNHKVMLWADKIEPGLSWVCPGCGTRWGVTWAIVRIESHEEPDSNIQEDTPSGAATAKEYTRRN